MVSTFFPPYSFGGDAMHIYRLSNELGKRGHSVDVFHCEDAFVLMNGKEPSGDFPLNENVNVRGLRSGKGFFSPLATQQTGSVLFKPELVDALKNNDYHVIHYNNMSLIGLSALALGNAVKLYTTHEHWLICPMHVLWKYDREVCLTKDCLKCQIRGKRPPQLWRYSGKLKAMVKHVDKFLSPSRFTLTKHLDAGLDIPIEHLPYFLPTPKSEPVKSTRRERPYFLFVGRLEKIKGVQNLIPIFKNRPNFDLLIAGDGDYRTELEIQANGVSNVHFLGRLAQSDLQDLYASAVAVVVPSICYETFGIIVIEAFSRKTPVIVNDLGALPETVKESGGGFIYGSDRELIAAMDKLGSYPELRTELGNKGFDAFLRNWNETAHLEKYLGIVERQLAIKAQKRKSTNAARKKAVSAVGSFN